MKTWLISTSSELGFHTEWSITVETLSRGEKNDQIIGENTKAQEAGFFSWTPFSPFRTGILKFGQHLLSAPCWPCPVLHPRCIGKRSLSQLQHSEEGKICTEEVSSYLVKRRRLYLGLGDGWKVHTICYSALGSTETGKSVPWPFLKKKTERGKGRGVRGEEGEKIDQYTKNRGLTC